MRTLYQRDDYKFIIHYIRAFPDGDIPAMQYLLVSFHPLVVALCGHYSHYIKLEWRDLLSFAMQRFIELVYRYPIQSGLYFRTYIQIALRRAIRDKVLFESRRHLLHAAVSLQDTKEGETEDSSHHNDPSLSVKMEHEGTYEVAQKLVAFAMRYNGFTRQDRLIFEYRILRGMSIHDTSQKTLIPSAIIQLRDPFIRKTLKSHAQAKLL
jgi:DNA-directed RNA polymerase specialized sigma24 family protein